MKALQKYLPQLKLDATKSSVIAINGQRHKARKYLVGGTEVELYTVNVLAKALGKTADTVRRWEYSGQLPKPLFQVVGNDNWLDQQRWYSRAQILNLHQAILRFPFSAGNYHLREAFFTLANLIFDEGEVVDVGEITVRHAITPTARAAAFGGTVSTGERGSTHIGRGTRKITGTTVERSAGTPAKANAAIPKRIAPAKPESRASQPVDSSAGEGAVVYQQQVEHRGHRAEPTRDPVEANLRHATGAHPRPQAARVDYRRRPSGSA
jgi:hypothetical protein